MSLQQDKTQKKEDVNKEEVKPILDGKDVWKLPDFSDAPRLKKII